MYKNCVCQPLKGMLIVVMCFVFVGFFGCKSVDNVKTNTQKVFTELYSGPSEQWENSYKKYLEAASTGDIDALGKVQSELSKALYQPLSDLVSQKLFDNWYNNEAYAGVVAYCYNHNSSVNIEDFNMEETSGGYSFSYKAVVSGELKGEYPLSGRIQLNSENKIDYISWNEKELADYNKITVE